MSATMIPADGGYFDPKSGEQAMFNALSKLPTGYYVFHSYRIVRLIPDKGLNENEVDFLVFHPDYGCLFIECKNAKIDRDPNGNWYYVVNENGTWKNKPMKDPFDQAFSGQHNLFNKLRDMYPEHKDKIDKCKFMVAVWLPKYTKRELDDEIFTANITKELIITREALLYEDETERQIKALMERMKRVHLVCKYEEVYEDGKAYKHELSHEDSMDVFKRVLCPTFRAIVNTRKNYEDTYIELLEEQYVVLDFLAHQRTAAISGASGTGKTLVAVERARRLSDKGDKVLFLCFNRNLMESLEKQHKDELPLVDFYTLDAFGCKKCGVPLEQLSYYDLKDILETEIIEGKFEYKHIIVDEGQDFGKYKDTDSDIKSELLDLFSQYGSGEYDHKDTSFFIFYDKNQLVNSSSMPNYLINVDSKLTLYRNCRNTKNIANVAYSLLEITPVMNDRAWDGEIATFVFYSGEDEFNHRFDNIVESMSKTSGSERVAISCSDSIKYSALNDRLTLDSDGRNYLVKTNGKKTKVFTSPTFKGLEADDVIVIDLNSKTFAEDNCDFYVAASRAKRRLVVMIDRDKVDVNDIIEKRFKSSMPLPNKEKQIALAMHGVTK